MTDPNTDDRLRSLTMFQLVPTMLDPRHRHQADHEAEVRRRWNAATAQKTAQWEASAWESFGRTGTWERFMTGYDHQVVEQARQYLAVQTLIFELHVLHEAFVAPSALYTNGDAHLRVIEVLRREQRRRNTPLDPNGAVNGEPDPLGAAAAQLARSVEIALFGKTAKLLDDQLNMAGNTPEDLMRQRDELCRQVLTRLRGPWSLRQFLTRPVGKDYYQPNRPTEATTRLDVALGRSGHPAAAAELRAARIRAGNATQAEARRLTVEDPPPRPATLDPAQTPRERLLVLVLHRNMRTTVRFLTAAAGVASLAADHALRVDGRPVAPHLQSWVFASHLEAADDPHVEPTEGLTIFGLRISLLNDLAYGTHAVVDAGGTVGRISLERLAEVLAMLQAPDVLALVAIVRHNLTRLRRDLTRRHRTASTPYRDRARAIDVRGRHPAGRRFDCRSHVSGSARSLAARAIDRPRSGPVPAECQPVLSRAGARDWPDQACGRSPVDTWTCLGR